MIKSNLETVRHFHLIGIGGCGVSAIAKILYEMGYQVSGSDIKETSNTIRLRDLGVQIYLKHHESNLRGAGAVVYSSAIPEDNPELSTARSNSIPVLKRAEMLAFILKKYQTPIGVAGTHGKTTTTSMISKVLLENNLDPTFLIGGETDYIDGNARLGKGNYAVAEADESDGSFLELELKIGIVTNVEMDHMEYFKTSGSLFSHFAQFASQLKDRNGLLITSDHPNCTKIFGDSGGKKITYGLSAGPDLWASEFQFLSDGSKFNVNLKEKRLGEASLSVPGEQNISNALACTAVCLEIGIPFSIIAAGLQSYAPVKRRFQLLGEVDGIKIIDDYAHHPTEISATLKAARLSSLNSKKRIIAIFQPHRYTRTFWLAADFAKSFSDADLVVLTDIYSAGEAAIPNISGQTIFDKFENQDHLVYIPRKETIAEYLLPKLTAGDMVITMGAGNIYNVGKELLSRLKMIHERDQ